MSHFMNRPESHIDTPHADEYKPTAADLSEMADCFESFSDEPLSPFDWMDEMDDLGYEDDSVYELGFDIDDQSFDESWG